MSIRSSRFLARSFFQQTCRRYTHSNRGVNHINLHDLRLISASAFNKGFNRISKTLSTNGAFIGSNRLASCNYSRFSASTIMPKYHKEFRFGDYDVIGFDLDNTLLRYNVNELAELVYELLRNFLVDQKFYPPVLLLNKLDPDFLQKGLVLDTERGNVLKLSNNATVLRATHGTKPMTDVEIVATYGPDRTWDVAAQFFKDPLSTWNGPLSEKLRTLLDYFDISVSLVFAQAVDVLDQQAIADMSPRPVPYNVWPDVLAGLVHIYSRDQFCNGGSGFFNALKAQPERYMMRTSKHVIKMLQDLRASGKMVYLVTGSNADFVNLTASFSLGPNWRDLFDFVVCFAKKPGFFAQQRPFLRVKNFVEMPGSELPLNEILHPHEIYTQGNWVQLRETLARHMGKSSNAVKCLYLGDNLIQDVYTPVKHHDYDAVVICEELMVEDGVSADKYEFYDVVASPVWGSYFCDDSELTMWAHIIARYSQLCIPTIDALAVEAPVMHEFFSENPEGYFPNAPKLLAQ